jgi:hypothetical protein
MLSGLELPLYLAADERSLLSFWDVWCWGFVGIQLACNLLIEFLCIDDSFSPAIIYEIGGTILCSMSLSSIESDNWLCWDNLFRCLSLRAWFKMLVKSSSILILPCAPLLRFEVLLLWGTNPSNRFLIGVYSLEDAWCLWFLLSRLISCSLN